MTKKELSYAEAYTDFLKYCSEKEGICISQLVYVFKNKGIERQFREIYNSKMQISNAEYYRRIKGLI